MNRLTNVLANGSLAAGYGFDLVGNLQTVGYGNGVTNLYQYDSLNRLTNLTWKLNASSLANFSYLLGASGNRTNVMETVNAANRIFAWQYDSLYRLTNETFNLSSNLFYAYDPVGNRIGRTNGAAVVGSLTNQTFAYGTNDWLLRDLYDSDGNTTNSPLGFSQYNAMDQLVTNGGISIVYDGDGNRVSKTVGGVTTYYLVDDRNPSGYAQVLEEWTVSGVSTNLTRVYNYGLSLISQRQVPSGTVSYYGYDGHGSVRFLTSTTGTITDTYTYDAFGNIISSWYDGAAPTPNNYLYCGQQFDPDLGLYYNRARCLSTDLGRFWTSDQTGGNNKDPLSLHKYLYCQNNPVNGIDPSGHEELVDVLASSFIQSSLSSMGMSVASSALSSVGGQAVAAFIPPQVTEKISSSPEPDAVLFGFSASGNLPVGKYPVGFQVGGGAECLVSPKTHGAALYGYLGGGLNFGANEKSAAIQGVFGFAFDTPNSQSYTEHFVTLSLPYSKLPASLRNKVAKFLASGFGAALTGTSSEVIENAKSIGCDFATAVNLGTVNIFFDPTGGGSCGVSFSTVRVGTPNAAPSNIGATYSYYWQLLPTDDKPVPFR